MNNRNTNLSSNGRRKFIKSSAAGIAAVSIPFVASSCTSGETENEVQSSIGGHRVRKSVMDLSAQEKADFTNGILELKRTVSPFFTNNILSYYDGLVRMHQLAVIQALSARVWRRA